MQRRIVVFACLVPLLAVARGLLELLLDAVKARAAVSPRKESHQGEDEAVPTRALALKGTGRMAAGIVGDGDFLVGDAALRTAAHYKLPCLLLVANNRSSARGLARSQGAEAPASASKR